MDILEVNDRFGHVCRLARIQWRGRTLLQYELFPPVDAVLDGLMEYKRKADDVWICSFPKSGSHWTFEIISMLLSGEAKPVPRLKDTELVETYHNFKELESRPSPRAFYTHLNISLLPPHVFQGKVIYVLRNPLSVALSTYHHDHNEPHAYPGSMHEFLAEHLYETSPTYDTSIGLPVFGSWFTHAPAWWEVHRDNPNVLFIFYEEMRKDHLLHIKKIAKFLGKSYSDEFYQKVLELTQIETMQRTCLQKAVPEGLQVPINTFFRKGQIDEWKQHLTSDELEEFMKFFKNKLKHVPDLRDRIMFE